MKTMKLSCEEAADDTCACIVPLGAPMIFPHYFGEKFATYFQDFEIN